MPGARYSQQIKDEIVRLNALGIDCKAIAKRLGVSQKGVWRYCNSIGILKSQKNGKRPMPVAKSQIVVIKPEVMPKQKPVEEPVSAVKKCEAEFLKEPVKTRLELKFDDEVIGTITPMPTPAKSVTLTDDLDNEKDFVSTSTAGEKRLKDCKPREIFKYLGTLGYRAKQIYRIKKRIVYDEIPVDPNIFE